MADRLHRAAPACNARNRRRCVATGEADELAARRHPRLCARPVRHRHWVSRRMASETDYILAGRRLGVGLVTFSVFATYFGAEAIVASGGAVYEKGLTGALVDPVGYAAAIILVGALFRAGVVEPGAHHLRRPVPPALLARRGAARRHRAAAWLRDLGGGPGARVRPDHERQLGPRPRGGDYARRGPRGAPTRSSADCWRTRLPTSSRVSRWWSGLILLGAVVAAQVGGIVGRPGAGRAGAAPALPRRGRLLDTLEQLAIPICGTIVAVELISRFLGARTAEVARLGTVLGRRDLSADRVDPGVPWADGTAALPALCRDAEQIVPRLAEVFLPGVLYVAFVGAIISAILSAVHAALHAPASQISHNIVVRARSRPQRPRQAVVRAPDGDGAECRRLSPLGRLPTAFMIWSRRRRRSAAPGCSSRRCLRCSRASADRPAPMPRWLRACSSGPSASMLLGLTAPYLLGLGGGLRRLRRRRAVGAPS